MKEMFQQLAAYNSWANNCLISSIQSLPEEKTIQEVLSSFPTLRGTLLHMWDAESIWWQRMKLQEGIIAPSVNFKGSTRDVSVSLLHQNKLWENWVSNASPAALDHVIMYYSSKREPFKIPITTLLMQVFNHGSYHRGQLVTMLRQLGVSKIPQTDFLVFTRSKK
ncbi:MAG: hypothetical protein H7Y31_08355 [Chitinophagaceae bacterium]|nr:hypothetical protein [Chitinophagaceae bacterium]